MIYLFTLPRWGATSPGASPAADHPPIDRPRGATSRHLTPTWRRDHLTPHWDSELARQSGYIQPAVDEVEQRGDDISDIAVNLAARVMGEAGPGDIVVSAGVTHTTAGGQFRFEDLGTRTLEGIEQSLQLFAVELEQ